MCATEVLTVLALLAIAYFLLGVALPTLPSAAHPLSSTLGFLLNPYITIPLAWIYIMVSYQPYETWWVGLLALLVACLFMFNDLYRSWQTCQTTGMDCWARNLILLFFLTIIAYGLTHREQKGVLFRSIATGFLPYIAFRVSAI